MGRLLNEIYGYPYSFTLDGLEYSEDEIKLIHDFIELCINHLGIKEHFKVIFVSDRSKHGVKTTAFYRDSDKLVCIYGKNRMLGDVLRSLAHELVHKKQYEEDRITHPVQDIGGEIENEANYEAGILVKLFIRDNERGQDIFNG